MTDTTQARTPHRPLRVGVRIPSWASFTHHIFEGIIEYVRMHRERWQIQKGLESSGEVEPIHIDEDWEGDGLIVFRPTKREVSAWKRRNIPLVNLSSEALTLGVPSVIPDNAMMGTMAAQHLLDLGLTRFAYWGDPARRYSQDRGRAFAAELKKSGFECKDIGFEASKVPHRERWHRMREQMCRKLARLERPIGIFVRDDIGATALIGACSEMGYQVPNDVAVIGCNNDVTFCHSTLPPLSSVAYPGKRIGYEAAALLGRTMKGSEEIPLLVEVPPKRLAERESSDMLAFSDETVVEAVRFVRREAPNRALQVAEVIEHLPISRAAFQKRFLAAMSCTPKEEITRVRSARVRELLTTSDWSVKEISFAMQFDSPEELSRFIRRNLGTTATELRREL